MKRPRIYGHRGAAGTSPENTHAAFTRAFALGADGIELDVRCCASGEVVVIHDATVERTSNGAGRVNELSLTILRTFDFGRWYAQEFVGETIPTLQEVFECLPAGLSINVEIKREAFDNNNIECMVARLIAEFRLRDRCLVSSFNPLTLWRMQQADPQVALAYLYRRHSWWSVRRLPVSRLLRLSALHPHHTLVTAAGVAAAHRRGMQVNTWTVNERSDFERVLACGVDGIVTDYPERLRAWLETRQLQVTAA